MIHHVTRATRHLLFWLLITTAVGSVFVRVFLTGVENYKAELEQKFHDLTDIQLQIGSLRAGTRGFNPEIILRDIDILSVDEAGKPAVQLKEVRVGIDVLQVLMNQDIISSTWITLVGAKVAVVRQEDGSFTIKGLNAAKDEEPLWLFKGGKYEILQSEISWQDKKRHGSIVTFKHFDLLIKNDFDSQSHEIHLLSDLPSHYGDSLRISANFHGDIFAVDHMSGALYLEGDNIQFAELLSGDLLPDIKLDSGQGSFKLWSEWQDSIPYAVSGYIQSQNINIKRGHKSLALDKMDGTLSWYSQDNRWRVDGYDLSVEAGQFKWPAAEFNFASVSDGHISALIKKLDLHEILYFAPFFLTEEVEKRLPADLELGGILHDFAFYVDGSHENYAVNGSFSELSIASGDSIPELKGLSGHIFGTSKQGLLTLDTKSGSIFLADLFRKPIVFDRSTGEIAWHQNDQAWRLISKSIELDTADFKTHSRLDIKIPKTEQSVFMDLKMAFNGVSDAKQVSHYLPAKIMGTELVDWLDNAFISGNIRNGGLLLSGNLNEFPFKDGQGKFEVLFDVDHGDLQYHLEWPKLSSLDASVHFFANSLQVKIGHAQSEQVIVNQAVVDISDLEKGESLRVKGVLSGKVHDGLVFMQKTPQHSTVDGLVESTEITGSTEVDLNLKIPLVDTIDPLVNGVIHLKNARLLVKPVALPVDNLTGEVRFTEQGVFSQRIDGSVFGFPARAKINTEQAITTISVTGKNNIQKLQQQFPFLQNDFAKGQFVYSVQLDLPAAENEPSTLDITTDLEGVTMTLPALLAKSAKQKKTLDIKLQLSADDYMPVMVNYSDDLKAALLVNKTNETLHSGHIVYGQGQAREKEVAGFVLDINRPFFNVSEWLGFIDNNSSESQLPLINEININTEQLVWGNNKTGRLDLAIKRIDQYWQGSLSCFAAKGALRIPVESGNDKKIVLQMAYLDLTQLAELDLPDSVDHSQKLPLIDIFSEQLWWQGIDLGQLELESERLVNGIRFNKIKVSGLDNIIELKADWVNGNDINSTALQGTLSSTDFGGFLNDFGYGDDLKKTAATIDFSGGWNGAPYQFSLSRLQAQMNIDLRGGRISSIEPGFGRLLGLIAMEQWVKRFTLDFSDIYKKGLAFNRITGNFSIDDGKALTDGLLIDAISARFKITGETDLIEKTLNHRVWVVPKSSAALPIAGTIMGGIASVLTQVFTDDYKEGYFFGSGYKIEGKWGEAEITPLHDRDGLLKKTWTGLTDFPWLKSGAN